MCNFFFYFVSLIFCQALHFLLFLWLSIYFFLKKSWEKKNYNIFTSAVAPCFFSVFKRSQNFSWPISQNVNFRCTNQVSTFIWFNIFLLFYYVSGFLSWILFGMCSLRNTKLYNHENLRIVTKPRYKSPTKYYWRFQAWGVPWLTILDIIVELQSVKRQQNFFYGMILSLET